MAETDADTRGPRERLYDEQINPLMAQVIALCKEHDIPIVACFQIDDDRDTGDDDHQDLLCTTVVLPAGEGVAPQLRRAAEEIRRPRFSATRIQTRDAAGNVLVDEVIIT